MATIASIPRSFSDGDFTTPKSIKNTTKNSKLKHARSVESLGSIMTTASSSLSFPESLELCRQRAKKSTDPYEQLAFVQFLVESAEKIQDDPAQLGIEFPIGERVANEEKKMAMKKMLEDEALRWLKRLALSSVGMGKQPVADAQFLLAELYGKGDLALPVDHSKAFNLYFQASKQNHPTATYRAAVCYEVGAGTKRDNSRAVQLYRKAAALGDSLAMHKLALILLYGKMNQRKNLKEGITWLKRAANLANESQPESLNDLAQCYERRGGCPVVIPDEHYAFELYSKAAQFGFAPSQYRLGTCYEFGLLGASVDASLSIKWYRRAAEQAFPEAELALSSWYLSGSDGVIEQSDTDAYHWAQLAADRHYSKAEYQMGTFYEAGIGASVDVEKAMQWYTKASVQGYKKATQRLEELKRARKKGSSKCILH